MKVLVTGSAGFIGAALVLRLLSKGYEVIGIDNHNNYYDLQMKQDSLSRFLKHPNYTHIRGSISDRKLLDSVFENHSPKQVVNLAAQAGVRYSMENPGAYIDSNIIGFANILECCRWGKVEHLVYASSSSVYGANTTLPFAVNQNADHPLSLYAASKRSNELMAHSYSHLYDLPATGLRFFTVYGPWARPDMALFKFTKAILAGEPITLFNNGIHQRDFTYIDDVVEGISRVLKSPATANIEWDGANPDPATSASRWRIYNIGNNLPVPLIEYVEALEHALGLVAKKVYLPLQPGDVPDTHADVSQLIEKFDYSPTMSVIDGVSNFVAWYKDYFKK
jgi:UDP-glucuronate 4-epimerase